ncbi:MAG: M20/M25/M40 family metallo-hydrolase [Desulfurococcales archaeon]|nr:M20/M25/M40 family metallo-hydrolase [Desulfurococcales archaeon]
MEVLELLAELVALDTVNDPLRGKRVDLAKGEEVARVLERAWGRKPMIIESNGVPTLIYTAGQGAPVTLFLAHFDTVPIGPGWSRPPLELTLDSGKAYGRGAVDDKANVAAITMALRDLEPPQGTIVVAFTSDEEIGGANGAGYLRSWLQDNGLWPDSLVNGDGSLSMVINRRRNAFNVVVRVRRMVETVVGCTSTVEFRARIPRKETMHAAYFTPGVDTHPLIDAAELVRVRGLLASRLEGDWVKSNVIPGRVVASLVEPGCEGGSVEVDLGLTRLLEALIPLTRPVVETLHYSDYGVTATPNIYRVVDDWHEVVIDVRAMAESRSVLEAYTRIIDEVLGDVEAEVEVRGGGGYLYTPAGSRLVTLALSVNRGLGLPDKPVEAGGASDSRYFSPLGVKAIDYGPRGGNVHGPDEYVEVEALEKAVRFYREMARSLHGLA